MAFPVSPTNGQIATVNGITYVYNDTYQYWTRTPASLDLATISNISSNIGAYQIYANANAATQATALNTIDANIGAYQTYANVTFSVSTYGNTNVEAYIGGNIGSYQTYANTKIGTNTNGNLVVVATTPSTDATTGALVVRGGAGIGGDMYIAGNIVPAANVTYDLGSSTTWFRDLWLSAGTIHIGGAKITQDPASGAIAIVPKATANNPNPKATIFSATGAVITANTAAGIISSETIATAATSTDFNVIGNLTANTATIAGNIFANKFYTTNGLYWTGNGVAFSSGMSFAESTTPPAAPALGDQWYNTTEDILYEFIGNYWVDVQSPSIGVSDYNNVAVDNISVTANITTANIYADRFFYSNGTAFSSSNFGNTEVAAYLVANPQGSTYSNTNVEAYLGANLGTATTNITTLFSNAATQATSINTINANLGTATTNINTTNANIGAFQTYANLHFSDTSYGNSNVTAYLSSSNAVVGTGAITLPSGATDQRPGSPLIGMIRYNTTLSRFEGYLAAGGWQNILSDNYSIDYLIVAGGGGGGGQGSNGGGGGGAGGYLSENSVIVAAGAAYPVVVGAGGAVGTTGSNGVNSSFYSQTSVGGGGGGTSGGAGNSGGSGGGRGRDGGTTAQTNGTAGQGNAGGAAGGVSCSSGGGGGGAGQAGYAGGTDCGAARSGTLARGGDGLQWLNGTYYAGGGGSAWEGITTNLPPGGTGGGGTGGSAPSTHATAGTTNTGGGGGGGQTYPNGGTANAGAGGSGVVIVRYLGAQRGSGGTVTSTGGYTYHTFTGSGTFTA
jgi:hypothetical protein